MKKTIYLLAFILCCCISSVSAQKKMLSQEEFRQKQQQFLTERAELTTAESQKFFPLYFELQDKKHNLNKEAWQKMRKGNEPNATEAEYDKIIEDVVQIRITLDQMELEYVKKYRKFLSARKIYLIQKAEMKFHREILKNTRGKK